MTRELSGYEPPALRALFGCYLFSANFKPA